MSPSPGSSNFAGAAPGSRKLPIEPLDEGELRELLLEAGIDVDPDVFECMLVGVQPIRGMLRSSDARRRRAVLRGAALTAGWRAPDDDRIPDAAPPGTRSVRPAPPEVVAPPRPTLRHLVARLGAIYLGAVVGSFALMSMMGEQRWVTVFFAAGAVALLLLAITGRGLGGRSTKEQQRDGAGTVIGMILLMLTGAGPLLGLAVASLFSPGMWGEGGMGPVVQLIGLVTLYVVGSHVRAVRRS